jgi:hypothetical protein
MATEGFPGEPTVTVFSVRTAPGEEAVDIASATSAMPIIDSTKRLREARDTAHRRGTPITIVTTP